MKATPVGKYKDLIIVKKPSSYSDDGIGGKVAVGETTVGEFYGDLTQVSSSMQLKLNELKRGVFYTLKCRYFEPFEDESFDYWIENKGKKYAIHIVDCDYRDNHCEIYCYKSLP